MPDKVREAIFAYLSVLANPVRAGTYAGYMRPLNHGTLGDSWLKCSEEMFERYKTEYVTIHGLNPKTGARMKKPQKLKVDDHTKADLIRNVLRCNIDATYMEVGKFYGDEELFSSSQVSTCRGQVREEQQREKKQLKLFEKNKEKTAKKSNGVKKGARVVMSTMATPPVDDEVSALKDENSYLRWQLEGERAGFFDRWLEENEANG